METDQWWYVVAERKAGPVSRSALQDRAHEGLLQPADPVWREGLADWIPAGSVDGLEFVAQPGPPPAPAPGLAANGGRNRVGAALFAMLLGGLGAHKFYLGEIGLGVVYLLFCWTMIPSIVGVIEGIVYLSMSDEAFAAKYR